MPLNSIPPTVDVGALAIEAGGRRRAVPRRRRLLGRRGARQPRRPGRPARRGRVRLQVLPGRLAAWPSSRRSTAASWTGPMAEVAALDALLIVHAEDAARARRGAGARAVVVRRLPRVAAARGRGRGDRTAARPSPRRTGARVHVLHLSSAGALPLLRRGRADGVRVTVETCPHYLTLARRGRARRRHGVQVLPADPRRGQPRRLWDGARDGMIDCVVSDHSPSHRRAEAAATPATSARPGAGSRRCSSACRVVWTAARERGVALPTGRGWMAPGPADLAGLSRKGRDRGRRATPTSSCSRPTRPSWSTPDRLQHRHPVTPYAGRTLRGRGAHATWLRGRARRPATAARGRAC